MFGFISKTKIKKEMHMRLKILLTPVAFFIAIVVAIWYIWPVAMDIWSKTEEIKVSQKNLDSTLTKKSNVEVLTSVLDKNKDREEFISNFLPPTKNEEKIVNGINYLANDSGVNLAGISITNEKASTLSSGQSANTDLADSSSAPIVKYAIANVNISGKYENIKIFISQIHKMEIINKVSLLSISKELNTNINANANVENAEGGDTLIANVEIKFGYMPYINQAGSDLSAVFSQSNFNFGSYSKINELIARKIPVLDTGQKGKVNPFLP